MLCAICYVLCYRHAHMCPVIEKYMIKIKVDGWGDTHKHSFGVKALLYINLSLQYQYTELTAETQTMQLCSNRLSLIFTLC